MKAARSFCFVICCLIAVGANAQDIITRIVERSESGDGRQVTNGVFDSGKNLRVYYDRGALTDRMAAFGAPKVSKEVKDAARITEIAEKGLALVKSFTSAVATGSTEKIRDAGADAGDSLREAIRELRNLGLTGAQIDDIAFRDEVEPTGTEEEQNAIRNANFARMASNLFRYLEQKSAEQLMAIQVKLSARAIKFSVIARVSRDQDNTRRREVAFLSPLTSADQAALDQVRDFATKYADTPGQLLDREVQLVRDAAEKALEQAKKKVGDQVTNLQTKWGKIVDAQRDTDEQKYKDLKGMVERLQRRLRSALSELSNDLEVVRNGSSSDNTPSAVLQKLSGALANARAIVSEFAGIGADVTGALTSLDAFGRGTSSQAVTDLKTVLNEAQADASSLRSQLEAVATGSVQSVLSAIGIGRDMKQIAEIVAPGDLTRNYADLDMTTNGEGQPLHLLAGDEVLVGVRIHSPINQDGEWVDTRKLTAYPDKWTSDRLIPIVFAQRDRVVSAGGTTSQGWKFAPTYMDVFKRYSTRRSADANRWLTPGFGIAISALDQDGDDSYEIGLGAGLSLLDDRLVGGYGWNLQRNKGYFFFGVRLGLRDLGISR